MKRSSFFLACLVAGMLCAPAAAQSDYQIKGSVTGTGDTWAYLSKMEAGEYRKVDSVRVRQGAFVFQGKAAEPNQHLLELQGGKGGLEMVLENKVITVQGQAGKWWEAKVTGSPLTDEAVAFEQQYSYPVRKQLADITAKVNALQARGDTAGAQQLMQLSNEIFAKHSLSVAEYIAANPQAFQSLVLLHATWRRLGPEKSNKMLGALAPQWQQHSLARQMRAAIREQEMQAERAKVGTPFAGFKLPDANGQPVDLASLRGKYVFIDFWASWCGPCRAENPNLVKAYQKFKAKPFEIVGISLDDKKEPWLKAIEKDNLPWVHVSDLKGWKNDLALHYGIKWIPSSFLLDPEGRIIARDLRGDALDKMLSELLE